MEQGTLKYLRLLIPGLIFLIGFYPIYIRYFSDIFEVKSIDFSYLTLLSVIIGGIYYQLNIQRVITCPSHFFITKNICNRLITISGLNLTESQKKKVKNERKYMHVFYNLLDKDESLKRKTANVYFNGIFWTSTADSFLINLVFFILYKYKYADFRLSSEYSNIFLILAISSIILHVISVFKHIYLSNDQLEYLATNHQTDVNSKMNAIL
jgi:hypothetical protein